MPPQLDDLLARVDQCSTQAHELSAHFEDLREQIRQAIDIAQRDPEMSLIRSRKVLEYIVVDIYDESLKPKLAGTQPLEGLVQTLVKEGQFPNRLAAYADMVRGLGNVGAHGREKGVSAQDVLSSLSNLLPIVEWFFEQRKSPGPADAPTPSASANGAPPVAQPSRPAGPAAPVVPQPVLAVSQPPAQSAAKLPQPRQVAPAPVSPPAKPAIAPARPRQSSPATKTPAPPSVPTAKPAASPPWPRTKHWAIGVVAALLVAAGIWYFTHHSDSRDAPAPSGGDSKKSFVVAALETKTNSLGMKLTLIPAGEFMMGSPEGEAGAEANEHPQHRVRITRPFYLGTYSVTRGQFAKFVAATNYKTDKEKDGNGKRGSGSASGPDADGSAEKADSTWRNPGFPQTDEHPVVEVSWNDAVAFCKWLSNQEGKKYRLPTEAEWEYACRAGTTTAYFFGDNSAELAEFAHHTHDSTAPVGTLRPNPFGLYDIIGNSWQWCADWYGADYYKKSPADDPPGPPTGAVRVERGGSWRSGPARCRSAVRDFFGPGHHGYRIGFRVVCER